MSQSSAPMLGDILTSRQKFLLLNSLMMAMFISALDSSIVSTATPHILADLGGFNLLSWVFTVYLLASTVVVPLVGKLSDMFGRKPFILIGIAIFVTASAACGAAPTMPLLILARAVQGIGGGMLFGCVFATIGDMYTPIERAKYMGYFIMAFTLASLTGPTIGGILTDGPGWRWCFYINLPVGAAAAALIWANLPNVRQGGSLGRIDFLGAALLSASTICVLLGLVWSNEEYGWASPETIGLFVAGAVLCVAFVFQESRHSEAILPLTLFRNRVFVQSNPADLHPDRPRCLRHGFRYRLDTAVARPSCHVHRRRADCREDRPLQVPGHPWLRHHRRRGLPPADDRRWRFEDEHRRLHGHLRPRLRPRWPDHLRDRPELGAAGDDGRGHWRAAVLHADRPGDGRRGLRPHLHHDLRQLVQR